ncbi:MAG: LysR family transcriptional regulator [Alphaproteobacteria bacterium]
MLRATFRQLQTFVVVAEAGSFAAAAVRLSVSPAAVSDQIRALEKKMGCSLFDRRPGTNPILNDKGEALFRKAPDLLDAAEEVESLSAAPASQRVRVGAGDYILEHLFLPNLARFQHEHSDTLIEFVRLSSSREAVQAINAQRLDLAYVAHYGRSSELSGELIGISRPLLFVSPNHPIKDKWSMGSKTKLPMIMPPAGSFLERMTVQILADAGIEDFDVATRAQHPDTIISLAMAGVGVGCLMREHAFNAIKSNMLVGLGATLPPLYRFAFRHPSALEVTYIREVDEFALALLRDDLTRADPPTVQPDKASLPRDRSRPASKAHFSTG